MSVSKVLYSLVGDKSVVLQSTEFHDDHVILNCHIRKNARRCSCCGSYDVTIHESKERTLRTLSLGNQRTYLKILVHKLLCHRCHKRAWMQLPFASGKLPMTKSFMLYIVQLTAMATLLAVAILLGLQWKTVKNIDKQNLAKRAKQFSFKKLRYISVDEIAIKKRHKYMTIFTDIPTGQIIYAVEGRNEEVLRPFLRRLAKKAKHLRGIGMDMSAAYASSIRKNLPNVAIIFDRVHVTKLLNDTVDRIRRAEYARCKDEGLKVLKGQRYLLLRNFGDLDGEQRTSLQTLLEINQPLAIAHSMKEQFRCFWDCGSRSEGVRFLCLWVVEALASGVQALMKTARSLLERAEGLLSYFDHRINNGKAEGINNKIKVLKRQAYGFRDQEYFKLRLYHLHNKELQLVG